MEEDMVEKTGKREKEIVNRGKLGRERERETETLQNSFRQAEAHHPPAGAVFMPASPEHLRP